MHLLRAAVVVVASAAIPRSFITTTTTTFTAFTPTSLALFAPAASATWLTTATTDLANGLRHLATSRISVNNTHTRDFRDVSTALS